MPAPGPTTVEELLDTAARYYGDGGAPIVDRLYEALPSAMRRADTAGVLRRYLDALGPVLGGLELLLDAVDYLPPDEGGPDGDTSLLVDPSETAWPSWLAWLLGVDLARAGIAPGDEGQPDARELIGAAVNGYRAGSAGALEAAARRFLTGTRTVIVRPGVDPDPHVITLSVVAAEVTNDDALEAAVVRVLPAGHGLSINNDVGNWAGIEAAGPWGDLEDTAPTWGDLEDLFA